MKIFLILSLIILTLSAQELLGAKDTNETVVEKTVVVADINLTNDANETLLVEDSNITIVEDINSTLIEDANLTNESEESTKIGKFEETFVNHTAYISYQNAIKTMYEGNYKDAYAHAMNARKIFYAGDAKEQIIPIPYMPSYVRESAYSPKRIYYKLLKYKQYELRRVITKIKLMSPPIATVILKRTSTYIDIIVRNYGDLPLDDFEILLNNQSMVKYEKILPNEEKIYKYESAPALHEISFKEEFGFAPNSIMLNEGY